jgi:hypothetical protein
VRTNFFGHVDSKGSLSLSRQTPITSRISINTKNLLLAEIKPGASLADSSHKKRGDPLGYGLARRLLLTSSSF